MVKINDFKVFIQYDKKYEFHLTLKKRAAGVKLAFLYETFFGENLVKFH